jgi:hypothetical protein
MNHLGKSFCLSLVWLGCWLKGSAQDAAPLPDPSHVVFVAPDTMKWEGEGGQRHVNLLGDPPSRACMCGWRNGCRAI